MTSSLYPIFGLFLQLTGVVVACMFVGGVFYLTMSIVANIIWTLISLIKGEKVMWCWPHPSRSEIPTEDRGVIIRNQISNGNG